MKTIAKHGSQKPSRHCQPELACAVLLKLSWPHADTALTQLLLLASASLLTSAASLLAAGLVRLQLQQIIHPRWTRWKTAHGH
jgi:hypothetical protein